MGIDRRKGIIEEHNLTILVICCSGKADSLSLSARESDTLLPDFGSATMSIQKACHLEKLAYSSPSGHISTSGRRAQASIISLTLAISTSSGLEENVMLSRIVPDCTHAC